VRARFAAAAAAVLGEPQAARLAELVDGLESLGDAAALSRATRRGRTARTKHASATERTRGAARRKASP
jgi:hypothetical protein